MHEALILGFASIILSRNTLSDMYAVHSSLFTSTSKIIWAVTLKIIKQDGYDYKCNEGMGEGFGGIAE